MHILKFEVVQSTALHFAPFKDLARQSARVNNECRSHCTETQTDKANAEMFPNKVECLHWSCFVHRRAFSLTATFCSLWNIHRPQSDQSWKPTCWWKRYLTELHKVQGKKRPIKHQFLYLQIAFEMTWLLLIQITINASHLSICIILNPSVNSLLGSGWPAGRFGLDFCSLKHFVDLLCQKPMEKWDPHWGKNGRA